MRDHDELNRLASEIITSVAELPDRNSPEGWPEAMIVTGDELRLIITEALAAQSATPAARAAADDSLREFARWAISESSFQGCDLDGSDAQDKAHRLRLLKEVQVSEPCSEIHCACAEAGADFPTTCYRFSELLTPPKTQEPQ